MNLHVNHLIFGRCLLKIATCTMGGINRYIMPHGILTFSHYYRLYKLNVNLGR